MSNQVFMLLGGALQAIICGILLYIAGRISKLYELMIDKVDKDDCSKAMDNHNKEIQNLWKTSRSQDDKIANHGERIAKIEK